MNKSALLLKYANLMVAFFSLFLSSCATLNMKEAERNDALIIKAYYTNLSPEVRGSALWFNYNANTYVALKDQNDKEITPKYIKPGLSIFPSIEQGDYYFAKGIKTQRLSGQDMRTTLGLEIFDIANSNEFVYFNINKKITISHSGVKFMKVKLSPTNLEIVEPEEREVNEIKKLLSTEHVAIIN